MPLEEFFADHPKSKQLFEALHALIAKLGPVQLQVMKSQIKFRRRKAFAWVWRPGQYLRGQHAPLVLTLVFRQRIASPRWKEIVEPRPGYFTHHLELYAVHEIDAEVRSWLQAAWEAAA